MGYNVVYIGNNAQVCDYIHCLEGYNVVGVICQDFMVNDDLLTCIYTRNIPLKEIKVYKELLTALNDFKNIDFCVMCSFALILKEDVLSRFSVYNIHTSYLPAYKGRHPTFYATLAGEKEMGISLHKVVPGIDEGDIIAQRKIPYYFWMSEILLTDKLFENIPYLLRQLQLYLTDKDFKVIKNASGSYYPVVNPDMATITETMPVKDIINLSRTQERYKGVKFIYQDEVFFIKAVTVSSISSLEETYTLRNLTLVTRDEPLGIRINEKYYLKFIGVSK